MFFFLIEQVEDVRTDQGCKYFPSLSCAFRALFRLWGGAIIIPALCHDFPLPFLRELDIGLIVYFWAVLAVFFGVRWSIPGGPGGRIRKGVFEKIGEIVARGW